MKLPAPAVASTVPHRTADSTVCPTDRPGQKVTNTWAVVFVTVDGAIDQEAGPRTSGGQGTCLMPQGTMRLQGGGAYFPLTSCP